VWPTVTHKADHILGLFPHPMHDTYPTMTSLPMIASLRFAFVGLFPLDGLICAPMMTPHMMTPHMMTSHPDLGRPKVRGSEHLLAVSINLSAVLYPLSLLTVHIILLVLGAASCGLKISTLMKKTYKFVSCSPSRHRFNPTTTYCYSVPSLRSVTCKRCNYHSAREE
jgi:hypothetical protein